MSNEPQFRLALAGAGRMGRNHLRALAGNPLVAVTHVVEPVAAVRSQVAAETGLPVFASVEDLAAGGDADGLLVAAPTGFHVAVVAAAAKAGLSVLCEKPAGLTPAEVRACGDAATAAGVTFQVAYWRRYVPALRRLRERIGAGEFGEVLFACAAQWDGEPPAARFRAGSGGIFIDMGVHEFDELRWLTGQEITRVSTAAAGPVTDAEVRAGATDVDSAQALLAMSGGATAVVTLGRHYPGGDMASIEIFGTRGHERLMFLDPLAGGDAHGDAVMAAALARQAEAFAARARGGPGSAAHGAGAEDAVAALDAAAAAAAAARETTDESLSIQS